jgi:CheY-like chemotaxis protein
LMPRIDGIELLHRVRQTTGLEKLPVILCTGASDRSTVERAAQLSANHYIVKPFTASVVISKLDLIEADLRADQEIEDPAAVCTRLGIDLATREALVDAVLVELHDWITATRAVAVSKRFDRMAMRANGLKGGCVNLGLRGLGQLIDAAELILTDEAESELRTRFVLTEAEIFPILDQIALSASRVRQSLPAAA